MNAVAAIQHDGHFQPWYRAVSASQHVLIGRKTGQCPRHRLGRLVEECQAGENIRTLGQGLIEGLIIKPKSFESVILQRDRRAQSGSLSGCTVTCNWREQYHCNILKLFGSVFAGGQAYFGPDRL
ncbi:hypothetical protein BBL07_12750 [Agrobacterium vitis]|nr:hypothetical protein BBL07_12750 [Agrobacterium vitis]